MNIRVSIFWNHLYILLFFFKVKLSPIELSSQVKLNPILLINDKLFMKLPILLIEWSFLTIYNQIKKKLPSNYSCKIKYKSYYELNNWNINKVFDLLKDMSLSLGTN